MNIHHFFHIYADGVNVPYLVNQHLIALRAYGLSSALAGMHVGIVGKPENRAKVKEWLKVSKFCGEIGVEEDAGFEQVTLNAMYEHSLGNDGYYLYTHTKSAANPSLYNQSWARSMEFFCVVRWRLAIEKLATVDAVGCHWITKEQFPFMADQNNPSGYPYFGGNFWWAKAAAIRVLGRPALTHRWCAEHWIGKKIDIEVYDLCPGWPDPEKFCITF
jgi:hypothetical protein